MSKHPSQSLNYLPKLMELANLREEADEEEASSDEEEKKNTKRINSHFM